MVANGYCDPVQRDVEAVGPIPAWSIDDRTSPEGYQKIDGSQR
jgi:hypothetical protein